MGEIYTDEAGERDTARSQEILAALDPEAAWLAAELMSISFRAGVRAGQAKAGMAMLALAA